MSARGSGVALLLRYTQRNSRPIRRSDKTPQLLRSRQPRLYKPKGHGINAHAKCRAPFLRDGLAEADDAGFGEGVVGLARIAVHAGGTAYVDNVAGFTVFDAEVGGGGADEFERRGGVDGNYVVPLLVAHLLGE